jgi:glycosyltransferase involved in cell wall biosynthesis
VVYNGIDFSRFQKREETTQNRSMCMVANFSEKKDHESLIRSLPLVLKNFSDITLILVGRGKNEEKCRMLASSLGIGDHVIFENSCNSPEDIIRDCSIGILLSPAGEGISNVILEYMALGIPVIATDLGGNREVVEHGLTGVLLPDHSTYRIADEIGKMFEMPERAKEMGSRGRERVEKKFDCKRMILEYIDLYSLAISKHSE